MYEVEPIHQKHSNYKEGKLLDQRGDKDALLLQTLSSRLAPNKCREVSFDLDQQVSVMKTQPLSPCMNSSASLAYSQFY